jgi:hypothetical protein
LNCTFGWSASSDIGTDESGMRLEIMNAVRRIPKALSCQPGCQMDTFSAFQVSTGPTLMASVGTNEMLPPPLVRAFCAMVSGCRSTTRVASLRYSAGVGGWSLNFPVRRGGSLKAQCFTSPCPPCITTHRTLSYSAL